MMRRLIIPAVIAALTLLLCLGCGPGPDTSQQEQGHTHADGTVHYGEH